jgi:hypothetical protein
MLVELSGWKRYYNIQINNQCRRLYYCDFENKKKKHSNPEPENESGVTY